jgi:signal transduction histidine kinase
VLRNATTRLVALHLVLVALATALVLGFVYWQAGGVIDAEQRQVVEAELRGLADDYAQGGVPALARAIDRRLARPQARDGVYLLAAPDGRRLAGNLADWPPTVTLGEGWVTLDLYRIDAARPTTISAVSLSLPRGERLLVGRDVAARAAFDRTLVRALGWGLAAMAVVAAGTGWLLSRLVLRRIDEVGRAAEAIMAGALGRRVASRGTGDEFDRLAGTLNAMLDRIEALVGDLRMVTDSLAHDLRSPLGRLARHLDAASEPDLPVAERQALIARASAEAETVLGMATALLDISRIEAGLAAEQFEPVDLARIVADVADLYAAVAEERGVVLAAEASLSEMVDGHPQLLAQAVSNLVDNALRHAPGGSMVTLAAGHEDDAPVIRVADRGPGIPEADRARVRERFVRLDPSRGGEGTGLGLALVDAVARLHGARLTLGDNAPGLVVELRFPSGGNGARKRVADRSPGR